MEAEAQARRMTSGGQNHDQAPEIALGATAEAAAGLVSRDRNVTYGMPDEDFRRTVRVFRELTGIELTPAQGMLFLVCVKLSREANAHKADNLIDVCGYADIMNWTIENGKNEV